MLAIEFYLCDKMLEKDERNFHVWNYRNWVISIANKKFLEKELKFT